jgi:glyoxylase I family protein
MKIVRCLHALVHVADLARAEQFYGTVLGLTKVERSLKFPGAWYEVAGFQVHLAVVDAMPKHDLPEKWGRDRHVAFSVENLAVAMAQLQSHGYPVQMSASGRAALFTQDPDGNVIEISEA